jgi:F420-dependent oxidoreductase-like protein
MHVGLHVSSFSWQGGPPAVRDDLVGVAAAAEAQGFAKLSVMDHVWQIGNIGPPEQEMLEAYTTLGFLAGRTEHIELLAWVTAVVYREPGLLAKAVTTLDVLSGGRAWLGIGAAWNEPEAKGVGLLFPPLAERFERLEEALQIARLMFAAEGGTFAGTHYRLDEATNVPAPVQPGGPRIMVGGSGERKTLRLVAQYADACNLFGLEPDEMRHKIEVLDRHCADVGRDPGEVQRTAIVGIDPLDDTDGFLRRAEAYAALGIEQLWVSTQTDDPVRRTTRICEELLPRLDEIG